MIDTTPLIDRVEVTPMPMPQKLKEVLVDINDDMTPEEIKQAVKERLQGDGNEI